MPFATTERPFFPHTIRYVRNGSQNAVPVAEGDYEWLARAVAHEGSPKRAVAWALVQRWLSLLPQYETLASLVRAYAQPINPRWATDGDLHRAYLVQLTKGTPVYLDEVRRAVRRDQFIAESFDDVPDDAKEAALDALLGGDSPVPGALHYRASSAPAGASKKQAYEAAQRYAQGHPHLGDVVRVREGYGRGVNWFFTNAAQTRVAILRDGDEPVIDPKDLAPVGAPAAPPPGSPTSQGWGWRWVWCYSPPAALRVVDECADGKVEVS